MTRRCATFLAPAVLSAVLASPLAHAGEVVVSPDFTFTYTDPAGYCLLDPSKSADEKLLFDSAQATLGPDSMVKLLVFLVDCPTLEALRTPGAVQTATLSSVGYAVELRDGKPFHSGDDRRDFVAGRAEALTKNTTAILETAKQKGIDPSTLQDMTADDSDPEAFAFGMAVRDPVNGDIGIAYAVTMIKGYGVMPMSLRTPVPAGAVVAQIAEARALAHDVIALNDPEGEGSGPGGILGFFSQGWVKGLVMVGVVLSAVSVIMQQRKAKKAKQAAKP